MGSTRVNVPRLALSEAANGALPSLIEGLDRLAAGHERLDELVCLAIAGRVRGDWQLRVRHDGEGSVSVEVGLHEHIDLDGRIDGNRLVD
jgi:hypothetical protein